MESSTRLPLEEFMPDLDELIDWMDALEFYARDWDQTFGEQTNYFTQEFWYMLIGCVRAIIVFAIYV